MAAARSGILFAVAVVAAVGGVAMMLQRSGKPGTPPPAPPAPAPAPAPAPKPDADPTPAPPKERKRPAKPPEPPEPPIPSDPEGCLAFLRAQAGTAKLPEGRVSMELLDDVRCAALDALVALDPEAAEPLVLQALGGDGDPTDWSSWRLHAAGIRIRAGKPDGAATVKSFPAGDADPANSGGAGATARAAAFLAPDEGAAVLQRLLAAGTDALDDEDLVAILQAAATLGKGADPAEMKKLFAEDASYDPTVLGAAAGALLRLGDTYGKRELDRIEKEEEWDVAGAEFAFGLGARGNETVVPWLERMRAVDEEWTRAGAVRALGAVGTSAVTPLLRQALKDADEAVAAEAAVALLLRGEKDVLPLVRTAAASRDDDLAIPAWRALAQAADAESKAAAEKLLGEPSPGLRDVRRRGALLRRIHAALLILKLAK